MRFLILECEGVANSVKAYSQGIERGNKIIKQIDNELQ